jgi:hypothetical protein
MEYFWLRPEASSLPFAVNGTAIQYQSRKPSDVYVRNLAPEGRGYPLHVPGLFRFPEEHAKKGVHLGDLGFLTFNARFKPLFNILLPRDDPSNIRHAPSDFEPLILDEVPDPPYLYDLPGDIIQSQKIRPVMLEQEDNR